jgi:YjbE family integral membrane protein
MIDCGWLGTISLDGNFMLSVLSIVFINIILSGDNAVVIAMAIKSLPSKEKIRGLIFGTGLAVILRVVLTCFAAQLLTISFFKMVGGVLITWIAFKLLIEGAQDDKVHKEATTFFHAIKIIAVADLVMSLDNVMGVAGACNGNFFLLLFGLGLSIPLLIGTSGLLTMIMDKYPIIVYIGAALLGKVGGELIITDPYVVSLLHPTPIFGYLVEAVFAVCVIVLGKLWMRWQYSEPEYTKEVLPVTVPVDCCGPTKQRGRRPEGD